MNRPMTGNRTALPRSGAHLALAVGFVFLVPIMSAGIVNPSLLLISLSATALAIMMVPLLRTRQIDWFSPWHWLFYFAFLTVFLRSIYITFDIPDKYTIESVLLLGRSKEFLNWPMVVVLIGVCCATIGYLAGPGIPRNIRFKIFQSDRWNDKRFRHITYILLLLSWVGVYLFISSVGAPNIDKLSIKHGLSDELGEYRSYGYIRWLISLSDLAFFLIISKMISTRRIRFKEIFVLMLSFLTTMFFNFYAQSRSPIVVNLINIIIIIYYLRGRKIPFKIAILVIPAAIIGFSIMSSLRYNKMTVITPNQIGTIEALVVNNTGVDVTKTALIMASMGKQLEYQYGRTFLNFLYMWIPRQLWPGKPTNVDTMIGMAIYNAKTYGAGAVPPGIIAEMYLNYWYPGVFVGCFFVGYLIKFVYTQFKAYAWNRNIVLLYVLSFLGLGQAFMGSGFSSALMSLLMTSIPIVIVLNLLTRRAYAVNR